MRTLVKLISGATVATMKFLPPALVVLSLAVTNAAEPIVYRTGPVEYSEELVDAHWCGRGWICAGAKISGEPDQSADALELEFEIQTPNGKREDVSATGGWKLLSHSETALSDAARQSTVQLAHTVLPLTMQVQTRLDGTSVLTRWLDIKNVGQQPIALKKMSIWSGRLIDGDRKFVLGHSLRDDNGYEGWFGWTALHSGLNAFSQNHGLAYDDPYFLIGDDAHDAYFFGQLAWPANFTMEFDVSNGVSYRLGPRAQQALRVIAPGEEVSTPAVHLGLTTGGFDRAVQDMHSHIRRSVIPTRPSQLAFRIECLMPEDRQSTFRGDAYNEQNVERSMEIAARCNAELFIVDGPTWARGYGDWSPKETWFPHGLAPLSTFAHQHDMKFGLYAEPEGGRGDWTATRAYQEHPEWFAGKILNLAIPAAAEYMESEWRKIIDNHQLDLYRHDINVVGQGENTVNERDGFQECDYWRHYATLDALVRRMHCDYPNVIFQQASGGGTRLDLATVGAWDEHFSSDENRYPHVYRMAAGMSVFLPPEIVVTPNGMYAPHLAPDLVTTLRGIYTLGNTPMLFNEVLPKDRHAMMPRELELFQRYSELYRSFMRPILSESLVYHHAPVDAEQGVDDSDWFAMEFAASDHQRDWVTVIRLSSKAESTYRLYPRGLDPTRKYRVVLDNTGQCVVRAGDDLRDNGLTINVGFDQAKSQVIPSAPESELVLFEAQ
jgi:alpha-galactosidase